MVQIHSLGFPRIGKQRELKFAQEAYWRSEIAADALMVKVREIQAENWGVQGGCDWQPVGDFSLYDQVLDASFLLGNVPDRVAELGGSRLDQYFRTARGRSLNDGHTVRAAEMTKWFDTNYHYMVPEVQRETHFSLQAEHLLADIAHAKAQGVKVKPVLLGPVTYLWLSKSQDGSDPLALLPQLLPIYTQLLEKLGALGVEWVQMDEPILVTDLPDKYHHGLTTAYQALSATPVSVLLCTYFGALQENLPLACALPVAGLHVDAVSAPEEVALVQERLPADKVLSLGVISGRTIWKSDLLAVLARLEPIARQRDRLWLAPSCSLLHVPVDLDSETALDAELKSWLAFATQKLAELWVLKRALNEGRDAVQAELADNAHALASRRTSQRVHNPKVQAAIAAIGPGLGQRKSAYAERAKQQQAHLPLPLLPTTTIGSFPQTREIRNARRAFKQGALSLEAYTAAMQGEIKATIERQEALGLDVLVHGEAERNDMVEYFGEQLAGYGFTRFGWVQSYGSRCVKPPILFGDISRPEPMTVAWTQYAQGCTKKPVKGMLTGPVTLLNWSFVRDDQPRATSCLQLALAMREEVLDLEKAGVTIIQIDEAALREGLPLRQSQWQDYLNWAVGAFRICANGVQDTTQIHTHMCYSEFNDIIAAIAHMDADVITIENSRSHQELLEVFQHFDYPNQMGPGVYDIHSPNTPSQAQIVGILREAMALIPIERLWVNPDCGLKTRQWHEVLPALENMVAAAGQLRAISGH